MSLLEKPKAQEIPALLGNRSHLEDFLIKRLGEKYFQSFNFYFAKPINELLSGVKSKNTIMFHDLICFDIEEEYLRRYYSLEEIGVRIQNYTSYYHQNQKKLFALFPNVEQHRIMNKNRNRFFKLLARKEREQQGGNKSLNEAPKNEGQGSKRQKKQNDSSESIEKMENLLQEINETEENEPDDSMESNEHDIYNPSFSVLPDESYAMRPFGKALGFLNENENLSSNSLRFFEDISVRPCDDSVNFYSFFDEEITFFSELFPDVQVNLDPPSSQKSKRRQSTDSKPIPKSSLQKKRPEGETQRNQSASKKSKSKNSRDGSSVERSNTSLHAARIQEINRSSSDKRQKGLPGPMSLSSLSASRQPKRLKGSASGATRGDYSLESARFLMGQDPNRASTAKKNESLSTQRNPQDSESTKGTQEGKCSESLGKAKNNRRAPGIIETSHNNFKPGLRPSTLTSGALLLPERASSKYLPMGNTKILSGNQMDSAYFTMMKERQVYGRGLGGVNGPKETFINAVSRMPNAGGAINIQTNGIERTKKGKNAGFPSQAFSGGEAQAMGKQLLNQTPNVPRHNLRGNEEKKGQVMVQNCFKNQKNQLRNGSGSPEAKKGSILVKGTSKEDHSKASFNTNGSWTLNNEKKKNLESSSHERIENHEEKINAEEIGSTYTNGKKTQRPDATKTKLPGGLTSSLVKKALLFQDKSTPSLRTVSQINVKALIENGKTGSLGQRPNKPQIQKSKEPVTSSYISQLNGAKGVIQSSIFSTLQNKKTGSLVPEHATERLRGKNINTKIPNNRHSDGGGVALLSCIKRAQTANSEIGKQKKTPQQFDSKKSSEHSKATEPPHAHVASHFLKSVEDKPLFASVLNDKDQGAPKSKSADSKTTNGFLTWRPNDPSKHQAATNRLSKMPVYQSLNWHTLPIEMFSTEKTNKSEGLKRPSPSDKLVQNDPSSNRLLPGPATHGTDRPNKTLTGANKSKTEKLISQNKNSQSGTGGMKVSPSQKNLMNPKVSGHDSVVGFTTKLKAGATTHGIDYSKIPSEFAKACLTRFGTFDGFSPGKGQVKTKTEPSTMTGSSEFLSLKSYIKQHEKNTKIH